MKKYRNMMVLCAVLVFSLSSCARHKTDTATVANKTNAPVTKVTTAQDVKAKVNINTANAKTLMTVKGIGHKRARAIINYRKKHGAFKSINDLNKLKGKGYNFSEKFIKSIANKITV